jgi:hypothetical protein
MYKIPNCWLLSARSCVHAESVGLLLDSLVEICLLAVGCGQGRRGEDGVKRVLMHIQWPYAQASKLDRGTRSKGKERGGAGGGHTCGLYDIAPAPRPETTELLIFFTPPGA